jgi:hypothetical protein
MTGGRYELPLAKPESVAMVASMRTRRVRITTRIFWISGPAKRRGENGEVGRDFRANHRTAANMSITFYPAACSIRAKTANAL